jgi:hypothetical protein
MELPDVLDYHQSLSARLGAQLVYPRLVRAFDSLFEGTITVVEQSPSGRPPPTWMEVAAFAKANPELFPLVKDPDGTRCCRFTVGAFRCSINEHDWRLIISGAVDRFAPPQETPEDEAVELATVEILEDRLHSLIRDADAVAEKARKLRYKLGGRKAGIRSREQAAGHAGLSTAMHHHHPGYDLREDLINQFTTLPRRADFAAPASQSPGASDTHQFRGQIVNEIMSSQLETLSKGTFIIPECDLCRRRDRSCVKEATACQSCAEMHVKCTWNHLTSAEAASLLDNAKDKHIAIANGQPSHDSTSTQMTRRGTPVEPFTSPSNLGMRTSLD